MTTEEHFQELLDKNPEDYHTRLVFADWLEERGDPRAAGYRALGMLRIHPYHRKNPEESGWLPVGTWWYWVKSQFLNCQIPENWWNKWRPLVGGAYSDGVESRRKCEDAAALAFSQLSPQEQELILNPTVPA